MKKLVISIAALAMFGCSNHKYDLKPTKLYWRNAPWDTKVVNKTVIAGDKEEGVMSVATDVSFKHTHDTVGLNMYIRNTEKLCIGTQCLDSVTYTFFNGELMWVDVYFPAEEYSKILGYLTEEFGKPHYYSQWVDQVYEKYDQRPYSNIFIKDYYHYYLNEMSYEKLTDAAFRYGNTDVWEKYNNWYKAWEDSVNTKKVNVQESAARKELNTCPLH